jgi:hypothetical protein
MSHPPVDDLPLQATSTLLDLCEQLSLSRHAGLARWALSVSDALLVRLVSVKSGERVDVDFEPCGPLAWLDAVELKGLRSVMVALGEASDDEAVVEWCARMGRLIVADFYRRAYEQSAIDAKIAVIEAEERRLACEARQAPD